MGWGFGEQIEETTFALSIILKNFKEKFDIIHLQDAHVAQALQFANRLKIFNAKVILGHGTEEPFWFLNKFDYLQHLAPYHLKEALENCGGRRDRKGWFAVPNFVDTGRFAPRRNLDLRRELNIPEDAFVVLSVAAIKATHKRVDYLVREMARLISAPAGHRNIYLVVAGGKTPQSDQIMDAGQKLLGDKIKFLVNRPAEQMPVIHNIADLFVLCSLKEMMPIALLEGLASGLPCLGNNYPVIEWMIGAGGECINMAEEGTLAETIKKYFNTEYRLDKTQKARQQALKNFSKEAVTEQILEMYDKVVNG